MFRRSKWRFRGKQSLLKSRNSAACMRLQVFFGYLVRNGDALPSQSFAVTKENVDESRVPPYVLPDPLVAADGARITTADDWTSKRRPEILRLFETEVYGRAPKQKPELKFQVDSEDASALGGKAVRKEVTIHVSTPRGKLPLHLLLYVPKSGQPAPVFLGLNFLGNQSVHSDPGITLSHAWILGKPEAGIIDHKATEASRGAASFALAGGTGDRSRIRCRNHVLRRYRSGLRRRFSEWRAPAVLSARANRTGRRRVGHDRGVGVGFEPRTRLS